MAATYNTIPADDASASKPKTSIQFGLTVESTGGPMCMTVVGKDLHAGLSVEALGCDGDAANPHNNDWVILKS